MSYRLYIGIPEDLGNSQEMYSFSKKQHEELFALIKSTGQNYGLLSEMQDYYEFNNYSVTEIEYLTEEINQLMRNNALKDNHVLMNLLQIGGEAKSKEFQLMGIGED